MPPREDTRSRSRGRSLLVALHSQLPCVPSQKYSTTTATPSASRNNTLRTKGMHLIPANLASYNKKLACTHGGQSRVRSTGVRPRQKQRKIGCPAQVRVRLPSMSRCVHHC
ncbi:hypothetical protein PybrP1_006301 [[Pythium] brassicae (nom. inval.)]|nr:hypothetical protein PybrP1_006301 [[Pythium] brassicae (nom. inval.)]